MKTGEAEGESGGDETKDVSAAVLRAQRHNQLQASSSTTRTTTRTTTTVSLPETSPINPNGDAPIIVLQVTLIVLAHFLVWHEQFSWKEIQL